MRVIFSWGFFWGGARVNNVINKRKCNFWPFAVGKQTHDLTVTASDSKTTQSGGDNRKTFPLGAALQVPQFFSFAPL